MLNLLASVKNQNQPTNHIYMYVYPYYSLLHVRPSVSPSEIIATGNHFNEEELAPSM